MIYTSGVHRTSFNGPSFDNSLRPILNTFNETCSNDALRQALIGHINRTQMNRNRSSFHHYSTRPGIIGHCTGPGKVPVIFSLPAGICLDGAPYSAAGEAPLYRNEIKTHTSAVSEDITFASGSPKKHPEISILQQQ